MLPNLQTSLYHALTTFETKISPWMDPSVWLDVNMKHIRSVFDGIVGSTENVDIKAMPFPTSPIFQVCELTFSKSAVSLIIQQRIIVYIFAYNILRSSDKTYSFLPFSFFFVSSNLITSLLGQLNAKLKKCQDWATLNLMRNQGNIKNELLNLFRNVSPVCLHVPFFVIISGLIGVFRSIIK